MMNAKTEETTLRLLQDLPVSSGNGKCCYIDDLFSPGCDAVGIKSYQSNPKYKDYNIQLVCSHNQDPSVSADPNTYRESLDEQPVVEGSSEPYEMCPHYADQCDARDALLGNSYGSKRSAAQDAAEAEFFSNGPQRVNISDDEEWQ